ncbi:MAG: hypothetical protein RR141_00225 [Rikenellaceae bacterium]
MIAAFAVVYSTNIYAGELQKTALFQKKSSASVRSNGKLSNFDLAREITIYSSSAQGENAMFCTRVSELLKSKGSPDVKIARSKGAYNINIEKVSMIVGVDRTITDAYCIKVYKNSVDIQYMSAKSMAWAYQALRKIIVENQSFFQRIFGQKSLYIQASSLCETSGAQGTFEVVDITENHMNVETLKKHISSAAMNNKFIIYLKLISTTGVSVMSELISSVNPFVELANGGLTYGQLNELHDFANKNGIELIPLLDLVSEDNTYFENYTGHKLHSTEGLRFSKGLINEFALKTKYEVICLGGEPANGKIKEKYIDPLVEIFNTYGRDVVIHTNQ